MLAAIFEFHIADSHARDDLVLLAMQSISEGHTCTRMVWSKIETHAGMKDKEL